jgi:hypothetical protein
MSIRHNNHPIAGLRSASARQHLLGSLCPLLFKLGGLGFCWVLGDVRCWDEIYGNLLEKKVWFIAGKIIEVNLGRFPATFENTGGDVGKILGAKVEI